jgi:hypothetical protein
MPEPKDEMPEKQNLSEMLSDPFWQVILQAHNADMGACERALADQVARDDVWYRQTWEHLSSGKGLTGQAFNDAMIEELRNYFAQPRARCSCGEHL